MKSATWLALCAATILTLTAVNGRAGILSADLSIDKTITSGTATPGAQITYSIVAENAGPNDAAGTTTVTDNFAASLSNCSWTCTASAGSSCTAAGVGNISDTVSLLVNGTATYTATCDIDSAATGNLDNKASHTPGTPVSYTIVAANNGPSDVSDALVDDSFGAPLSNCNWTSTSSGGATGNTNGGGNLADTLAMPAGSSVTYTATCDVDPAATGDLSNTATISSALVADPTAGNDSATDVSTLDASADLTISKTDGKTQHLAGTPITYTIVAQNNGPSAVGDAIVTDVFPAPLLNCSWTSTAAGGATGNTDGSGNLSDTLTMPVGSSVTYTAICGIPIDATGSLSNTATIDSASAADPAPGNESATDGDTVLGEPISVPTLSIWSLLALFAALALLGGATLSRRLV